MTKIHSRISRILDYWTKRSLHIPNVFRGLQLDEVEPEWLLEIQDLSKKELLVQNGGRRLDALEQDEPSNSLSDGKRSIGMIKYRTSKKKAVKTTRKGSKKTVSEKISKNLE
jgi:hypothetical protein